MILAFGWGDGGGGPARDHLEFYRRVQGPGGPLRAVPILAGSSSSPTCASRACRASATWASSTPGPPRTYTSRPAPSAATARASSPCARPSCGAAWPRSPTSTSARTPGTGLAPGAAQPVPRHPAPVPLSTALSRRPRRPTQRPLPRPRHGRPWPCAPWPGAGQGRTAFNSLPGRGAPWCRGRGRRTVEVDGTGLRLGGSPRSPLSCPATAARSLAGGGWLRLGERAPPRPLRRPGAAGQPVGPGGRAASGWPSRATCSTLYKDVPTSWDAWDMDSMVELMPVSCDSTAAVEVWRQPAGSGRAGAPDAEPVHGGAGDPPARAQPPD